MSCCGKKSKAFQRENMQAYSNNNNSLPGNRKEPKSKVFEYTGATSKKVKCPTGRIYYFRFRGHRIVVPYEDTFSLMAENDFKVLTK